MLLVRPYIDLGDFHPLYYIEGLVTSQVWGLTGGIGAAADMFDLESIVKATQVISGEIELDKLLRTLMLIIIESSGAGKGFLFLRDEGMLTIEVVGQSDDGINVVLNAVPLDSNQNYSTSIVDGVVSTMESRIVNDSQTDPSFLSDPYLSRVTVKSILCTPILRQGVLVGVVYLERAQAAGAFTPSCEKFIETLLSQAAISIENSRLYQEMEREINERRQAETALRLIAAGTASVVGADFFKSLVQSLATSLDVKGVLVSECTGPDNLRVRSLAFMKDGQFVDNIEYDLINTPCEHVIRGELFFCSENLEEIYPCEKGFKSYLGVPTMDLTGRVLGHLAILDTTDMSQLPHAESILRIFAARVGVELHRKRTQESLRASEEKYRLLVENQTDLVVKMDRSGRLQFVSPSCCDMFGKSEQALLGADVYDEIHFGDRAQVEQEWQKLFHAPWMAQFEHRIAATTGERWLGWSLKALRDESGEIVEIVGVGRDVTDRRKAEEQSRQNLHVLAHAGRVQSMGEMASTLAHELNQPLSAILSFSQASRNVIQNEDYDRDELGFALERIAANAKRAGDIISHMRGFIRKEEPITERAEINSLLVEALDLLNSNISHLGIDLLLDLQDDLPSVYVDSVQIQQVILNLVRNSMEAIEEHKSSERRITITTQLVQAEGVEVTVSDTGPGLSPDILENLFNTFISTKSGGMGIGLSICRSIVEAHGGELITQERQGGGAVFSFVLPTDSEGENT